MKKYDNFIGSFNVLKNADRKVADQYELYRMGVIGQFNLTFELAWKLLQAVLRLHSVAEAETCSPREIIKLGFRVGFITDEQVWLDIQKDRNKTVHVYNEEEIDEILGRIFERYIPAFDSYAQMIKEKIDEVGTEE